MDLLQHIRIFRRLAERKSFSAVAREIGVRQSTVSRAIALLESQLGVELFVRSPRDMALTAEGKKLLYLGGPLVDQLDGVLAAVKDENLLLRGQLKIAASLAFARLILTPMMSRFTQLHPDLHLNFQLGDERVNLIENGIDLVIRLGDLEDSSLRAVRVGSWRRALYAAPRYIEQFGKPGSIDDLSGHRLLYFNRVSDRPAWTFRTSDGVKRRFFFEPYIQADAADFVREALVEGLGIAYAPTWMMMGPEKAKKLTRLLPEVCNGSLPISILTAQASMSAKQRAFAAYLKEELGRNPEFNARD